MSNSLSIRRFHFGQVRDSWCTKCSGVRCEESIGFLYDTRGRIQGYIIDSEKLREAASGEYSGENHRLKNASPTDGVYKRPLDVKKLISKNPAKVNTVKFSNDILERLLYGVEGCDNFIKGRRNLTDEKIPRGKGFINLNKEVSEVLSGEKRVTNVELVEGSGEVYRSNTGTNPLTRGY